MQEAWVQFLGREGPLETEMATHSSILAWKIAWTEELVGCSPRDCQSRTQLSSYTTANTYEHLVVSNKLKTEVMFKS